MNWTELVCICALVVSVVTYEEPSCICLEELPGVRGLRSPIVLQNARDGSDRIFIGEQQGYVWVFGKDYHDNWVRRNRPFLNLTSAVLTVDNVSDERGLLAMTFHPWTPYIIYVYYSFERDDSDYTRLSEFRVYGRNRDRVNLNSERILLELRQPYRNHNGGDLMWDNRGLLYLTTGDGGRGGDPFDMASNTSTLYGKVLRIDPNRQSRDKPYGIPYDNPFLQDQDALDEVYAYGLRNPWRCSYDVVTDRFFLADVGQSGWEEVNIMGPRDKGVNYGWAAYEGPDCFKPELCGNIGTTTFPIYAYNHNDGGKSITGGFVYRGRDSPGFTGLYIYADWVEGFIARLKEVGGLWKNKRYEICDNCSSLNPRWTSEYATYIQSFGQDEAGELYILSITEKGVNSPGRAYKILDPFNYQPYRWSSSRYNSGFHGTRYPARQKAFPRHTLTIQMEFFP